MMNAELEQAMGETLKTFTEIESKDNTRLTLSNFVKCLDACGLKQYTSNLQASIWSRFQDRNRRINISVITHKLIDVLAADYIWWNKGGLSFNSVPDKTDPEVAGLANYIRNRIASKADIPEPEYDPVKMDAYFKLTWKEKAIIFRLRADRNRLNQQNCYCGAGHRTGEHILQFCDLYGDKRREIWPNPVSVEQKLYGTKEDLKKTAAFVRRCKVTI